MSFQTLMTFFLQCIRKGEILMQCKVAVSKDIFVCALLRRDSHTGLEQHEGSR